MPDNIKNIFDSSFIRVAIQLISAAVVVTAFVVQTNYIAASNERANSKQDDEIYQLKKVTSSLETKAEVLTMSMASLKENVGYIRNDLKEQKQLLVDIRVEQLSNNGEKKK